MRHHHFGYWLLCVSLLGPSGVMAAPIIADHGVVAAYADIPDEIIELVRAMWLNVPGESHSSGYRLGLELLEAQDSRFAVSVVDSGNPEGGTTAHLRVSRATWGDVDHATGWRYGYGEEDWYTSAAAIAQTKAHLDYAHGAGLPIAALGFGWCWDMTWQNSPGGDLDAVHQVHWAGSSNGGPDGNLRWGLDADDFLLTGNHVCLDTYLAATQEYIDHASTRGYDTVVFFSTGPVDGGGNTGESGYQRHLKNERIRSYALGASERVLFDYADILCWSDAGQENTISWTDGVGGAHSFPVIHGDNMLDLAGDYAEDGDHIGQRGALRLAKALWWMLARIAGWQAEGDTDSSTGPQDTDTGTGSGTTDTGTMTSDTTSGTQTQQATDTGTPTEPQETASSDSESDSSLNPADASSDEGGCGCHNAGRTSAASLLALLVGFL